MGIAMAASSALALAISGMGASAQELAAAPPPPPAAAPSGISEAVVAIVNDDIISSYDLMQRMRLILVTGRATPPPLAASQP